jgi:hypothetical protein
MLVARFKNVWASRFAIVSFQTGRSARKRQVFCWPYRRVAVQMYLFLDVRAPPRFFEAAAPLPQKTVHARLSETPACTPPASPIVGGPNSVGTIPQQIRG